jgi:predicted PurR-regulated permease PerM
MSKRRIRIPPLSLDHAMNSEKFGQYLRWLGIGLGIATIGWLLFHFLGNTINLLLTSAFFATAISPLVEELERRKIGRGMRRSALSTPCSYLY